LSDEVIKYLMKKIEELEKKLEEREKELAVEKQKKATPLSQLKGEDKEELSNDLKDQIDKTVDLILAYAKKVGFS